MVKFKKIYFLIIAVMAVLIFINIYSIKVHAVMANTEEYNQMCEEVSASNYLDEEIIKKYENEIVVVNGKYEYIGTEWNEDIENILQNIQTINAYVENNEGEITEDGLLFYCEDELAVQFGFTSVKWHWYGVDLKMDKSMIYVICFASMITNFFTGKMLTNAVKNGNYNNFIQAICSYIMSKIGTATKLIGVIGSKGYSKLINAFGSYDNFMTALNVIISTTFATAMGIITVACFASGGTAAIVWSIISYIIGLFTPGLISCVTCLIKTFAGIVNTATMKIRWLCGWGTNLYY